MAELYALKFAISKFYTMFPCSANPALVSDSTSSISTLLKFSCKAKHTLRGKVLRQISSIVSKHQVCFKLGFLPSKLMPADVPSRMSQSVRAECPLEMRAACAHATPLVHWGPVSTIGASASSNVQC